MESAPLKLVCSPDLVTADLGLPPAQRVESFLRMINCQPISQEEIAQRTGVTRRGVQKIVARLRDCGLRISEPTPGFPSRYEFGEPVGKHVDKLCDAEFAEQFAEVRRSTPRQTDYPKPQRGAPPVTTMACGPPVGAPTIHTTHRTYNGNGNVNGVLKRAIGKKLTASDLGSDRDLLILARHYQDQRWVPADDVGLRNVFRVAEHALRVGKHPPALFVSMIKKIGQQDLDFDPITLKDEDAGDRRFKRAYYGEEPTPRERDPLEEEIH